MALLLEKIYRRECKSERLLTRCCLCLNQNTRTKIPGGLKESVQVANKTGENDKSQHDIGIVYGANGLYSMTMSENAGKEADAVSNIQ